jgi:hypothetical protein
MLVVVFLFGYNLAPVAKLFWGGRPKDRTILDGLRKEGWLFTIYYLRGGGGEGMALRGCLLGLVYIGSAVWIFFWGWRECALHYNGVAMLFLSWLGSGSPGRYHQGKGLRYRTWIRDTVVATYC